MFTILFIVFSSIKDSPKEDFAIYLIIGIFFYHLFSKGTSGGLASFIQNAGILKSLNINREIFPVVAAGTTGIFLLVELIVLFGLMPVFDFVPSWTIILLPVLLFLFIILVLGISYFLSVLFIYVKDIQQIWNILVYSLLFVSPIFWYVSDVEGVLLEIQKINVLGQIIEITHNIVVFGQIPPIQDWVYTSTIIFGIFFVGYTLFQKFENKLAEKL
jgi:lipopolysaccharide transport system permease protein